MKLIEKEQQGDIMLLTFRDENGDIIVQPVALNIWKKIRRVRINDWRREDRRRNRDADNGVKGYIEDESETEMLFVISDPVCDMAEESDLVRRIYYAIELLPEMQKKLIKAYCIEGLTYRQIADRDGIPLSTIHRLVKKASENIKKIID